MKNKNSVRPKWAVSERRNLIVVYPMGERHDVDLVTCDCLPKIEVSKVMKVGNKIIENVYRKPIVSHYSFKTMQ
jgi:hypothetical protein